MDIRFCDSSSDENVSSDWLGEESEKERGFVNIETEFFNILLWEFFARRVKKREMIKYAAKDNRKNLPNLDFKNLMINFLSSRDSNEGLLKIQK